MRMNLIEVMRKDNPTLLRKLAVESKKRAYSAEGPDKIRKKAQNLRFTRRYLDTLMRPPTPASPVPVGWSRNKKIAAGVGTAALGLGAYAMYRRHKNKQKAKESTDMCFIRTLREGVDARHVDLGLNVLKATGLDQAMQRNMNKPEQRAQAWKYAKRGAALGYMAPMADLAVERGVGYVNSLRQAKRETSGVRNIFRRASELQSRFKPLGGQVGQALITPFTHKYGRTALGIGAGAGALYGLMKKAKKSKEDTSRGKK